MLQAGVPLKGGGFQWADGPTGATPAQGKEQFLSRAVGLWADINSKGWVVM